MPFQNPPMRVYGLFAEYLHIHDQNSFLDCQVSVRLPLQIPQGPNHIRAWRYEGFPGH